MKYLKIILVCLFLSLWTKSLAQWSPSSIYTGLVFLYDAINVSQPIGVEWQYKQISFELAPVIVYGALGSPDIPLHQRFDFDLGIKYYLIKGAFMGLNLGYVEGPLYYRNTDYDNEKVAKLHGVSLSAGYKFTIKRLYVSALLGLSFKPDYMEFEHRFFGATPAQFQSYRMGLMLGFKL